MYKPETIKPKPMSVSELIRSPQHYVRYGDACWIIMTGKGPKKRPARTRNSTGVDLTMPGMREDLRASLESPHPNVKYGIMPNCLAGWPESDIKEIAPDVDWWHGDLWKDLYVSESKDCAAFFNWLSAKRVCLVGPEHLRGQPPITKTRKHIEVGLDSYLERERVIRELKALKDTDVVLLSAGFLTQVVIWKLADSAPFQMIDTGAFLDTYAGVHSRKFHRGGRRIILKRRPT